MYNYQLNYWLVCHSQTYRAQSHFGASGSTWREAANTLIKKDQTFHTRSNHRGHEEPTSHWKCLQLLLFNTQSFVRVRERELTTATEAETADLASSYFYTHNMDELHWEDNYASNSLVCRPSTYLHWERAWWSCIYSFVPFSQSCQPFSHWCLDKIKI